jgi:hypothetical protein
MDEIVPPVLAEVLVAHKYPWDGTEHAVGEVYELPAVDFEAFLGMGYVRRCEHPDNALPGRGRLVHVEPHRGHVDTAPPDPDTPHVDHTLPGREPRPKPKPTKG